MYGVIGGLSQGAKLRWREPTSKHPGKPEKRLVRMAILKP